MRATKYVRQIEIDRMPAELWGLWRQGGHREKAGWIYAMDERGDPILCFATESSAQESAKAHLEYYGIECVPARII